MLQRDGRTSFKDLGKSIDFTGLGARKRVQKLLEQNIIDISALLNVEKLNLSLAIILLELESTEAMQKTIERYKDCPRVINSFITLGGYNLVILVMAEDQDTLECEAMEKCSLRSGVGIRRSEFFPIGRVNYSPFIPLKRFITKEKSDITPCGVNCKDCPGYQVRKCLGCPSVHHYKGPLKQ
jgi:Lrp/AsnC family transcriptional regulator for asnA, asnC and gidA